MSMVLDASASYFDSMLTEMLQEEVHILLGVSAQINMMATKLRDLNNFLADADRRSIADVSVQEWVGQFKRAMYEAVDILDLCVLNAMERGPSAVDVGCFNPLRSCMRNPLYARDIRTRITMLNKRLDAIKERSATYGFINLGSYEDRHYQQDFHSRYMTSGEPDPSGVVGEKVKEDTRAIVELLTINGDASNMVVAIVGVGGIGKTTLAQEVFNDKTIKRKFDERIWLSVGRNFDKVELLRTIIRLVGGDHHEERALPVLFPTLTAALTGKKLFLVMDDVWSRTAWVDLLERPFVMAASQGSRVLLTTRDERVARGMKAMYPYHRIDKLGHEDGWLLLKKQVLSNDIDELDIDALKDIGLEIISKCDGLPLAIKVMGGLLCVREKRRRDWEMVLNDSMQSASELPEEINLSVYLSYKELLPCVKQCFLHYCLLPNNTKFSKNEIVGMWISEGFVHGNSDALEELGTRYYKELILMNLIEEDSWYGSSVGKMHDIVRSFAQYVARDETLVAHNGETGVISKLSAHKFTRLSIETKGLEADKLSWRLLGDQTSLRTLILVGDFLIQPGDSLSTFSSLRTLHVESADFATLVECLYQLKHLRYLSIAHTNVSRLPDNISKLKFLQHISIHGCRSLVKLPGSIIQLSQLRYLSLHDTSINGIPRGFSALTNLRSLAGFPAQVDDDWCSLEELGPLFRLMALGIEGLENVSASSSAAKARLCEKFHLEELLLCCRSRMGSDGLVREDEGIFGDVQRRIEKVFDELCPPPSLETLGIKRYFGRRFPRWMMSISASPLKNLRGLMMEDLDCCTELPDGLCQLPNLEFIQISHAPSILRVGPEFLQHSSSQGSLEAFPRLHKMNLMGMVKWEEWEWEEQVQAMPNLEDLQLRCCRLRLLPPGLALHARALKKLCLQEVQNLSYLENFAFLVELQVIHNPDLERITNLTKLQKLLISFCPKLKLLEGLPELKRLELEDHYTDTLPEYMLDVSPMHLKLPVSLAAGHSGHEWEKLRHIKQVKASAENGEDSSIWHTLYTRDSSCSSVLEVAPVDIDDASVGENEDRIVDADKSSESTDSTVHVGKDKDELVSKNEDQTVKANNSIEPADKDELVSENKDKFVESDDSTEPADKDELVSKNEDQTVKANNSIEPAVHVGKDKDELVSENKDKFVESDDSTEPAVHVGKDKDELVSENKDQIVEADNSTEPADKDELVSENEDQIVEADNSTEPADVCKDKERLDSKNEDQVVEADKSSEPAAHVGKDKDELVSKNEDHIVDAAKPSTLADEHELVGIDSRSDDLIKFLMHGEDMFNQQLKIVSLCGIGGLGKTTIAKAAYRNIENEFAYRAFVSVPPGTDMMAIVQIIFDQVHCPYPYSEECDIRQLYKGLREHLQDKKYLIVVDDIWDVSVWDMIKPVFINNNCGSRIITTTRKVDVAEYIGGVYDWSLLSYDDSKRLFYGRTSYGSEDYCPPEYREISERILNKCGLLPLAIIAITSLLSDKPVDLEEWENVCNSIGSGLQICKAVEDMREVLKRSYDDLPPNVQNCLLYLRNFPEGCKIRRASLVRRWISEELIQREDGRALQEVGESYFDKLINASMIEPIEFDRFGSPLACHVPVIILDLIVSLSVEENSATIIDKQQRTGLPQPVQWSSLQVRGKKYNAPKATKTFHQMSSLFIFCGADFIPSISRSQELSVLDSPKFESLKIRHLKDVWKFVKLRYLSLGSSDITVIPDKIARLKHLQTLDLTATSVKQLPCCIVKLTKLRHLLINRSTEVPDKILGKLQALEELVEIDISNCPSILEDIVLMPELRVLSIALWSWVEQDGKLLSEALCKLSTQKLKHLSIFTCCLLEFKSDVRSVLQHLEKLEIQGCTFNKLPNWIGKEAAVSNLRSLSIEVYSLEKDALRTLGKLSHLLFLSLAAKRTPGEKLVICRDEFSSLKAFLLFNHDMAIKFEQGAMKKLQTLKLTLQASLTEDFSFGLENLSSLKHVQVEIICFNATGAVFKKAEAEIWSMIGKNPFKPTLEIITVPKLTVDEIEEDLR